MRGTRSVWGDLLAAVALSAPAGGVAMLLYDWFGLTRLAVLFLAPVALAGALRGRRAALFAAVASGDLYQVFLRFWVTQPPRVIEDLLNLAVFLLVALLTGSLAGRLREEVARSQARANAMERLLGVARVLDDTPEADLVWINICQALAELSASNCALIIDDTGRERARIGEVPGEAIELARHARDHSSPDNIDGWVACALSDSGRYFGSVAWAQTKVPADDVRRDARQLLLQFATAHLARAEAARLKITMESAEATARLREALLSSLSHDFRSPLSAIMASASSLLEYGARFTEDTRRDLLLNIQEEADRLNHYVGNLLNMSRLQAGAIEAQLEAVAVTEVIETAAARLSKHCQRPVRVDNTCNCDVMADRLLLEQAIYNVLDNAMKHGNGERGISVRSNVAGSYCEIEISDHGPGLSPEELVVVFEPFSANRRKTKGSGLGMSIVRGFTEAMGGSVHAGAREDGRSGLTVTLKLARAH